MSSGRTLRCAERPFALILPVRTTRAVILPVVFSMRTVVAGDDSESPKIMETANGKQHPECIGRFRNS
jgi:hypothetical protein